MWALGAAISLFVVFETPKLVRAFVEHRTDWKAALSMWWMD